MNGEEMGGLFIADALTTHPPLDTAKKRSAQLTVAEKALENAWSNEETADVLAMLGLEEQ